MVAKLGGGQVISGVRFQANMTLLHSSNTRGFFDPITLGFFVDGDLESLTKYKNDDIRLKTKATLHHELTHYFQFYGTTFGNLYLFHQWAGLAFNLTKLRKIQQEITALQTPLSQYVKSDDDEHIGFTYKLKSTTSKNFMDLHTVFSGMNP